MPRVPVACHSYGTEVALDYFALVLLGFFSFLICLLSDLPLIDLRNSRQNSRALWLQQTHMHAMALA